MSEPPIVQILEKEAYFTQHITPLPNALPLPPLAPSSIRIRTRVLSLTANSITYTTLGFLLRWWDIHPLPPSTPEPLSDPSRYGRISAWGYAEVLESTHPAVAEGSFVWGYLPIGTLPEDLQVEPTAAGAKGHIIAVSPHRRDVMRLYNRYVLYPHSPIGDEILAKAEGVAYDASVRVMYETAYLLNRFAFTADPQETVSPLLSGPTVAAAAAAAAGAWTPEMADVNGATVVCLAPGSKAALCFARELRTGRPVRSTRVVGAASEASLGFVRGTGEYDAVVSTDEDEPASVVVEKGARRVVLFDFGARQGVAERWALALSGACENFLLVKVGGGIAEVSSTDILASLTQAPKPPYEVVQVNASDIRDRAIAKIGEARYFSGLELDWGDFKNNTINGLHFTWGEGMEDVGRGWDTLCSGSVNPDQGLVYLV